MKWSSLLKDIKEKVGLTPSQSQSPSSDSEASNRFSDAYNDPLGFEPAISSPEIRGKYELEKDFKKHWEEFRSSSSEKEKETAFNMAVHSFCRLVKQHSNAAQLVTKLVEVHVFSFVVGRAFVTDVEKLKVSSKVKLLTIDKVTEFFSLVTEDGVNPGSNLLYAIEVLVTGSVDKQSLLDSGIFCCLIDVLNAFLSPDESYQKRSKSGVESISNDKRDDEGTMHARRLEVEGSIVHIMKALASHPSAAPSLTEDDSLQLLFHMVANGSLKAIPQFKHGLLPLHTIQLHRHAMQVLSLLLANDNGSTAKYIQRHHLIKDLIVAVKDFDPEKGDPSYTMGIVDLIQECVELSYRHEAGHIRLREDIHNAHGYQFLVQFALQLSTLQKNQVQSLNTVSSTEDGSRTYDPSVSNVNLINKAESSASHISPVLCRLLDVLVSLAQTGPAEPAAYINGKATKSTYGNSNHSRSRTSSGEKIGDEMWEKSTMVKDLEAIQMLQDIFLKADSVELQAEVLNRMFKLFSSHLDNYKLCQQLRTIPLFILNMGSFPGSLQEIILKILEYAVTVVNCIPEQELLSLCCLLQQPITTNLKHTILAFFAKLLSFDQQYKKVLREVGVLEVLLDDLKKNKFMSGTEHQNKTNYTDSLKIHVDNKDAILSSSKLGSPVSGKLLIFEDENTIGVAWDCLFSLLKKAEANQQAFRSSNGVSIILPLLSSESHRSGVLRLLSCLIIDDAHQVHPEELGILVEILKSGMVTSELGSQYKLHSDAVCDTLGSLWRILGANVSSQRVFGEATGFSLLLTSLHSIQNEIETVDTQSSLLAHIKVFSFLLRVMTAGVCNNLINRLRLHEIMSSQAFYDLLSESGLLCVDCEKQVIQLLIELALEIIVPPSSVVPESCLYSDSTSEGVTSFLCSTQAGILKLEKDRVYNASAIGVLIRSLLLFTPKVQLDLLKFIEKLAHAGPFNQENLTSVGCIGLLLETISPFLATHSPLLAHALRIVEVLGSYRLSSSELRVLVRYLLQTKARNSGNPLVDMMEKLVQMEDMRSENVALAPFIEMDMSKIGHASVQVSLGERTWPPVAGYSFVCWFQYRNFLKKQTKESESQFRTGASKRSNLSGGNVLRIFSVGAVDDPNTLYAELYLNDNGIITLATSNSSSLSFPGMEMEEDRWHHLAIVHSKPNALAGLFQASIAYVYINGKLRHTGKLGYSPSPIGKSLQVTLGTPVTRAKVSDFSWRIRCCYLFEEVLTSGSICFMYILGRGYRGLFQDTDILRFIPNQSCGGGSMAILDSLDAELPITSSANKSDNINKLVTSKAEGSGIVWDPERLSNLSLQLSGKKLIFAFDGTPAEAFRSSGTLSMLNLVDPLSAAASPIGGIPRFGRLNGDIYICNHCVIGDSICAVGGMAVVLALIEAAETRDMLHMALELLACTLDQFPQNVHEMQALRGYHLLALFLHHRMSLFDMQCLETFFQIAACEASFSEPQKLHINRSIIYPNNTSPEASFDDLTLPKFSDDISSMGSVGDFDSFSQQKDSSSHFLELENAEAVEENMNCIVLSNADMVEHVLLDWTVWVTAPISIQIALLGFLERMVSMHWYRNHNLTILRKINLVQHLLVTLQRGDMEVPVLEKLVVLLGVILEDGFLVSELELVVKFVIMTFDPPDLNSHSYIVRETMGKHVIVRNMLLEMLIDLQVTIKSDELLEQWHKIVSSKLITYFLDESVHPTSMRWVMTLLGICLASSPTFVNKFRSSGGYLGLTKVLPSFYDSPEIYYILFCLVFDKAVYPRVPEVRMLDFHALMSSDGSYGELKFVELIDSVIAMAKSTFDRLSVQTDNASHISDSLMAELADETVDIAGDFQGEALMHKTYAARLMSGEAAAPAVATSILRFMVDLAKMCPPFSAVCRRTDFIESCVDLYFSCVRADFALKKAKNLISAAPDENKSNETDDNVSISQEQEQSANTSITVGSYPQDQRSTNSYDNSFIQNFDLHNSEAEADAPFQDLGKSSTRDYHKEIQHDNSIGMQEVKESMGSLSSSTTNVPQSPAFSEKSNSRISESTNDYDGISDFRTIVQGAPSENVILPISPQFLLEIDDSGYGCGPCSAGANAVLDFIAEVLSNIVCEQLKATQAIESILESVPLFVDMDCALVFQGLCLSRLMNFLERRLLRDDEEDAKKLDKNRWSLNLESLCSMIVDRVYMGSFPRPIGVFRTLEFLLSMLQLANKDGRIEEAAAVGKGLLSISRGSKQLESYIHAILKNTNRMFMYCFLPSFLICIGENDFVSNTGFQIDNLTPYISKLSQEESATDICTVLQLLVANKRLVLCPSNVDNDFVCCLCLNVISLLSDNRQTVRNMAIDVMKFLLLHRRPALEDLLVTKSNQGPKLDVLHSGFDKLLTGDLSNFFEWFQMSEWNIHKVLEQCASIMWVQYVNGSAKFPGVRIKGIEVRRKREMGRKFQEVSKSDSKHSEQMNERRYALELVRDLMSTELRVIRQDKYGWVLHAESNWQTHIQQLIHERGIFPICNTSFAPEWQLCPIEGPYRMRKKLERCKLRVDSIQSVLYKGFECEEDKRDGNEKFEKSLGISGSDTDSYLNTLYEYGDYSDLSLHDANGFITESSKSAQLEWNDDQASSINDQSLHSAQDFGARSSSYSAPMSESTFAKSELASPMQSSSTKIFDMRYSDDKSTKEVLDNGEYLIRPFLEPSEKIRFRYNCERVVGLDKHDGIFLIGDLCLYVIENFYINDSGCICEKENEDNLSVIDQALGVTKDVSGSSETMVKSSHESSWDFTIKSLPGGRAWAYSGGAWGKEKACNSGNLPHHWHMWKLDSIHELLKRDYQLRPVAVEIFSMDGCNDLLVFHKKEREEIFKNLVSMNLPRNSLLDTTISGSSKQESNEGSRLFKIMAKSFSKRWQNGEISNFQYLMHLNTLAGRGYSDLTQYPVFPWVLANYESEVLDLTNPKTFRKLDKPMGCQTLEGEEEFKKRYESWDDPDVPKFHYGSHYSSAGIVLFYLLRLPPFSTENKTLQGGQFDHADRLFNSIRDTWSSAAGKGNTSDVKELIPEFFYMPEFLENRFNLDLGVKQSGEKIGNVILPPWANGSTREFIRKHREALESDYVSENLHHWIDLIFGYKQRGKAAEEATNVFYHYTYEGSVDIDSISDPTMKASILAQINHFGQTPKQLFQKPHVKRRTDRRSPPHPLRHSSNLLPQQIRKSPTSISQILTFHDKTLIAAPNTLLKPSTFIKYIAWGFPDRSLRILTYDQDRLLLNHENLHGGHQISCAGISQDGSILVTGGNDGVVSVYRFTKHDHLQLQRSLSAHTSRVTCLYVSQSYSLIVTGSDDNTVILWDLINLVFVKQLPEFPTAVSTVRVNDLTGEILTAAGGVMAVWSVNGDCLAVVNTSQLPSDFVLSLASATYSDWSETNWYVTGHQSGAVKVWRMLHCTDKDASSAREIKLGGSAPEYRLILHKVLKYHKHPVSALCLTGDLKQLLSGDLGGHLVSWTLPDEGFR